MVPLIRVDTIILQQPPVVSTSAYRWDPGRTNWHQSNTEPCVWDCPVTGIWNQWRFKPLFYAICIFLQPRCDDNRWHIANIDKTNIIVNGSVDSKSIAIAVSLSVLGRLGRSAGQSSQEQSLWPPGLDYREYTNKTTCLCVWFAMLWYAQVDLREFKLCNIVRWQEPALAKVSNLLATHFWSRCVQVHLVQGNINPMMSTSCTKAVVFWLKWQWNLFPGVQLTTIVQLNQFGLVNWHLHS